MGVRELLTARTAGGLGAVAAAASLLTACSGAPAGEPSATHEVAPLHREWIDRDVANATGDLVPQVLADYWVTDEELAQAQDDYRDCLAGWPTEVEVTFDDDGGNQVGPVPDAPAEQEEFDAFTGTCSDRAYGPISMYHRELRANPQGLTYAEAVRACFDENDVPDGRELPDAEFEKMIVGEDGGSPYVPQSQAGQQCLQNPFPGQG